MRIYNIKWETDGVDISLPEEIVIAEKNIGVEENDVADYLSDTYGFLVRSFRISKGYDYNIREIEALTEREAKAMALETEVIKEHNVYYVDLGEYFGYSCLVFKNKRHIYYANDYQLHHTWCKKPSELKGYYRNNLSSILFTEDEIGEPVKGYDEYKRKEYFLRNYYIMQVDYLSMFGIRETKEEKAAYNRKKARRTFDPISFAYVKDPAFVKKHAKLLSDLMKAKKAMDDDFEYQKSAFLAEMYDHEYSINWQADFDTLSAFGNLQYVNADNELESYFTQLGFSDVQKRAYMAARKEYYEATNM